MYVQIKSQVNVQVFQCLISISDCFSLIDSYLQIIAEPFIDSVVHTVILALGCWSLRFAAKYLLDGCRVSSSILLCV